MTERPTRRSAAGPAQRRRRPRLRIYIGAAPGVGKTYAMLEEAHALRAQRRGRRDRLRRDLRTRRHRGADQDLEIVPRRKVPYKGVVLEEMDVDAIVARRPQVCLVDELAHTNVPGSRHEKRYQDVLELLDHGISVMTAVNIQHLETLNDAVSRVTGVRVRETVPDTFLDRADEVINVDITVEELRTRLRRGQDLQAGEDRAGARATSSATAISRRCASWRCARSPTKSARRPRRSAARRPGAGADPRARHGVHELELTARRASSGPARGSRRGSARAGTRCMSRRRGKRRDASARRTATRWRGTSSLAESLGATVVRVKADRAGRRPDRLRQARGHHPRDLRPERALALGDPVEGVDAQPVSRGGARCGGAGGAVRE